MPINAPSRFIKSVSTALLIFVGFGCATAPDPSDAESYADFQAINDPIEPLNRGALDIAARVARDTGMLLAGDVCNTNLWSEDGASRRAVGTRYLLPSV